MFNSFCQSLVARLILLVASVCVVDSASAESPELARDAKGRIILRDERPDDARGWVTMAKSTYWPLCYEALDHLEDARGLIGKSKPEELAAELEKSGAWLSLAASAAMTDGKAGLVFTGDLLNDVGEMLRNGSSPLSEDELKEIISLAELCMAKSHVMRAEQSSKDDSVEHVDKKAAVDTKPASRVIQEARMNANQAQLVYDVEQSLRHLEVARIYVQHAAADDRLSVPESISAELPAMPQVSTASDLADFDNEEVSLRIDEYNQFIEDNRLALAKKFADLD